MLYFGVLDTGGGIPQSYHKDIPVGGVLCYEIPVVWALGKLYPDGTMIIGRSSGRTRCLRQHRAGPRVSGFGKTRLGRRRSPGQLTGVRWRAGHVAS